MTTMMIMIDDKDDDDDNESNICDVWPLAWHLLIDMSLLTGGPTIIIPIIIIMTMMTPMKIKVLKSLNY